MQKIIADLEAAERGLADVGKILSGIPLKEFTEFSSRFKEVHEQISTQRQNVRTIKFQIFQSLGAMITSSLKGERFPKKENGIAIRDDGVWRGVTFYRFKERAILADSCAKEYYQVCRAIIQYLMTVTPERSATLKESLSALSLLMNPIAILIGDPD
jgi:hypothetical protein